MKIIRNVTILSVFFIFYSCSIKSDKELNNISKIDKNENQLNNNKYEINFSDVTNQEEESIEILIYINDIKYEIDRINGMGVNSVERGDFNAFNIPKSANSAIESYWAGAQTVFYCLETNNEISVYRSEFYEEDYDSTNEFTLVFSIQKSKLQNANLKNIKNKKNSFYIININAVKDKYKAIHEVNKLVNQGYQADYLWIPDYNSLSKAEYFSVYIGPYETQKECEIAVSKYRKINPKAYGLLVSQENKRVQINGVNKISIQEPYH